MKRIGDGANEIMSMEDRKALRMMEKSAVKVDGHYQLALPWQSASPRLANNKVVTLNRLNHLKRKIEKDPEIH